MSMDEERIQRILRKVQSDFDVIEVGDIPNIDLYMDQVLTFMSDQLRGTVRDPENDKVLTKTMINNYVKNKVLIPPVKKKYGTDHIILLMLIFYLKNFLSIEDIRKIMEPVSDRYANSAVKMPEKSRDEVRKKRREYSLSEIYTAVFEDAQSKVDEIASDIAQRYADTEGKYSKAPGQNEDMLRRFDLILQLSADIYVRKMFIEKLVDELDVEKLVASTPEKKRKS